MSVAMTKWAIQHEPTVYNHMKERILTNLCPNKDMCGYLKKPAPTPVALMSHTEKVEVRRPRITYVSRQLGGRKFEDALSRRLDEMLLSDEMAQYFQVQIVHMQNYTATKQIAVAASTDIMLGVHGNGLTHAFWMPMHGVVIEVFQKGNCLYDYQWIAAASGQHWIGLTQEGVLAVGNPKAYCSMPNEKESGSWDSITIDLDNLKTILLTLRNMLNGEPLV